ncbi:unnamed protein product [Mytilus coruscus]|uniref:Uncharacterized protein n=1 Tax=Mytilus coruscus TaxID=42192 RepID=A0A6J8AGD2_MYTCO|nr:unnamed protein product [Mytilus coruscus]
MADRRAPRYRQRINQWDSADTANWTARKLKDELDKINIFVPVSLEKNMLKKINQDNIARRNVAPADQQMTGNSSKTSASTDNAPINTSADTRDNLNTYGNASSNHIQGNITSGNCSGSNSAGSSAMTEPRMNLHSRMAGTTSSKMAAPSANSVNNEIMTGMEFGVPSECIPHVDIVSDVIKKRIWEGKDINLAALLIPKDEADKNIVQEQGSITVNLSNHEDIRLHKSLTISEFITVFGKYKRVMCSKFPNRRIELERYEANIIDIYREGQGV